MLLIKISRVSYKEVDIGVGADVTLRSLQRYSKGTVSDLRVMEFKRLFEGLDSNVQKDLGQISPEIPHCSTDVFTESKVHVQQSKTVFETFLIACGDSPTGTLCEEFRRWGCNYNAVQRLFVQGIKR